MYKRRHSREELFLETGGELYEVVVFAHQLDCIDGLDESNPMGLLYVRRL